MRWISDFIWKKYALKGPKKLKLIPKNYYSKAFEGCDCRRLLKEFDKLNDPKVLEVRSFMEIIPYVSD